MVHGDVEDVPLRETILKRRNTDSFYFGPFKFLRAIREIERRINRQEKEEQTAEISKVN